jgi:O-antigen ligase
LLFFIPLISGLWTEDKDFWLLTLRVKLPLLLLPFAFAKREMFSRKDWNFLSEIFLVIVFLATTWSLYHYFTNIPETQSGYLRAKSLITPLENDRVRFSWLVSIAALISIWIGIRRKIEKKKNAWIFFLAGAWFIVFLHLLAVRTGLISIYLVALIIALKIIFSNKKKWIGAIILAMVMLLPLAAWLALPTFQNRVKYFKYDFSYFSKTEYLPATNDAVRVISLKAGWGIMSEHPLIGVGFGDIDSATRKWYAAHYPMVREEDKIWPSSEWLIYGSGAGWPGFVLFTFVMAIPFFVRVRNKFFWQLLNLVTAFSFLFDVGLEVQFGVFLYSFIVLWWWSSLKENL